MILFIVRMSQHESSSNLVFRYVSDLTDLLTIMVQENILSQGATTHEIELHKAANDLSL